MNSGRMRSRAARRSHLELPVERRVLRTDALRDREQLLERLQREDAPVRTRTSHRARTRGSDPCHARARRRRRGSSASGRPCRPQDGNTIGVASRRVDLGHRPAVTVEVQMATPGTSSTYAPATHPGPARSSTRTRSAGSSAAPKPVSMFTAGTRPAARVARDVRVERAPVDRARLVEGQQHGGHAGDASASAALDPGERAAFRARLVELVERIATRDEPVARRRRAVGERPAQVRPVERARRRARRRRASGTRVRAGRCRPRRASPRATTACATFGNHSWRYE